MPIRRRRLLSSAATLGAVGVTPWVRGQPAARRVLHVMSYATPWRWTDGQWAGFQAGLDDPAVQTQVFQMDTKRHGSAQAKAGRARLALDLVQQWRPDLVYLSDDDAVAGVARPLAGSALPVVFSGVNRSLAEHGLTGAPNITGVLEREHVVGTLNLLRSVAPQVRRVAVISDEGDYWDTVIGRVRERIAQVPDVTLARVDRVKLLADYQQRLDRYQDQVDAVLHLGIHALAGADGVAVPYQQVQRWVAEHSRLPDASFWFDRVQHGTLASMTVSEQEQGRAAGRLARTILHDGRPPFSLPVQATTLGQPALCLPRARALGLTSPATVLLSAEVVRRYAWDPA